MSQSTKISTSQPHAKVCVCVCVLFFVLLELLKKILSECSLVFFSYHKKICDFSGGSLNGRVYKSNGQKSCREVSLMFSSLQRNHWYHGVTQHSACKLNHHRTPVEALYHLAIGNACHVIYLDRCEIYSFPKTSVQPEKKGYPLNPKIRVKAKKNLPKA